MGCGLLSVSKDGGELGWEKGTECDQRCGLGAGGYAGPRAGQHWELGTWRTEYFVISDLYVSPSK